jgi:hypothetical protein
LLRAALLLSEDPSEELLHRLARDESRASARLDVLQASDEAISAGVGFGAELDYEDPPPGKCVAHSSAYTSRPSGSPEKGMKIPYDFDLNAS